jgi:hypothetical protein
MSQLRVRKDGSFRRVYGKMEFKIPLDNSITVEIKNFKKSGGQYRLLPYRIPVGRYCDFYEKGSQGDVLFYQNMANLSTFPYPNPCPFPSVSSKVSSHKTKLILSPSRAFTRQKATTLMHLKSHSLSCHRVITLVKSSTKPKTEWLCFTQKHTLRLLIFNFVWFGSIKVKKIVSNHSSE